MPEKKDVSISHLSYSTVLEQEWKMLGRVHSHIWLPDLNDQQEVCECNIWHKQSKAFSFCKLENTRDRHLCLIQALYVALFTCVLVIRHNVQGHLNTMHEAYWLVAMCINTTSITLSQLYFNFLVNGVYISQLFIYHNPFTLVYLNHG